jgi:formimidoylglutamate deiminase
VSEHGWLPDFIYTGGKFELGLAMFADAEGITRFSREPDDLARAVRMPGRAMLPGLVNVHSHTFQRLIRGRTEFRTSSQHDTFWTWRENMYRAANSVSPEGIYRSARMAFLEMALSGITTVGEFHYLHHGPDGVPYENRNQLALVILRAAEEVGIRIALLRTAYVRAGWKKNPDPGQSRFITPAVEDFLRDTDELRAVVGKWGGPPGLRRAPSSASGLAVEPDQGVRRGQGWPPHTRRTWVGVAPHSIRAVPIEYLREVAKYARANEMPLHMHVAEQPAEIEACIGEHGRRPVELLNDEGILDSPVRLNPRPDGTGSDYPRPDGTGLDDPNLSMKGRAHPRPDGTGLDDPPHSPAWVDVPNRSGMGFTAIHAIHITKEEAGMLGKANASVCACPTSERNLGDGAVPADQLYAAGAAICFGSDSNIQIDILEDARELEYHLRMNKLERVVLSEGDSLGARLFASATESGARSLQSPGGSLDVGRAADFFTVDLNDPSIAGADQKSLLDTIVFSLERTAIRDVVVSGEAIVSDGRHALQDEIVAEFIAAQRELESK